MFGPPALDPAVIGEMIEARAAEVQGQINALQAELARLIELAGQLGSWRGHGIRSVAHWVAWQTGSAPAQARRLVRVAERLRDLPVTAAAFSAGELSLDQAATVAALAPAHLDGEACELARLASPGQLRRALGACRVPPESGSGESGEGAPAKRFGATFGWDDDGDLWLRARCPAAVGAQIEAALVAHREALVADWRRGQAAETAEDPDGTPTWLDALARMAERSQAAGRASRPSHRRTQVLVHVDVATHHARLHLGPALSDAERRLLTCDATYRVLYEHDGRAIGVGRRRREIPVWLRRAVEQRDGGCRVPGCTARVVQVHHVRHWEDGGATEPANCIALCPFHHRRHHRGALRIRGSDADDPSGITFSDERGRPVRAVHPPTPPPPGGPSPPPPGRRYVHPTGERMDYRAVHFPDAPAA